MKTSTTLSQILVVCGLLLTGLSIQASGKSVIYTNAVRYENTWIPQVDLKEISITSFTDDAKQGTLCRLINNNGNVIPSVQLNEVTINSSGIYENKNKLNAIALSGKKVKMVPAILNNGEYIAHYNLPEINVFADAVPVNQIVDGNHKTSEDVTIIRVGVRQSFDRLAGFLLEESKMLLKKMIPGM